MRSLSPCYFSCARKQKADVNHIESEMTRIDNLQLATRTNNILMLDQKFRKLFDAFSFDAQVIGLFYVCGSV